MDACPERPGLAAAVPRCAIPVALALVAGAVLRLGTSGWLSIWGDEAVTFRAAVISTNVLSEHGLDEHPLSYYYLNRLLGPWITGNDWLFRLPSAISSVLALALWPVCLRLLGLGRDLRAWCVLLLAVLPVEIRFSHEARAYAFIHLFGILALTCYAWARVKPSVGRLVALAVATLLSALMDGVGLAVPGVLLVFVAWQARRPGAARRMLVGLMAGLLLAVPYYAFRVWYIMQGRMRALDPERLDAHWVADSLLQLTPFSLGFAQIPAEFWPMTSSLRIGASVAIAVLGLAAIGLGRTRWQRAGGGLLVALIATAWAATLPRGGQMAIGALGILAVLVVPRAWIAADVYRLFALLVLIPIGGFLAACMVLHVPFWYRYLLVTLPGLVPLTALAALRLGRLGTWIPYTLLGLLPLAYTGAELARPFHRADNRGLAAAVLKDLQPGDGLVAEGHRQYPLARFGPLRVYAWRAGVPLNERLFELNAAERGGEIPTSVRREGDGPADDWDELKQFIAQCPSGRVWVLSGTVEGGRDVDLSTNCRPVRELNFYGCKAALWQRVREATP